MSLRAIYQDMRVALPMEDRKDFDEVRTHSVIHDVRKVLHDSPSDICKCNLADLGAFGDTFQQKVEFAIEIRTQAMPLVLLIGHRVHVLTLGLDTKSHGKAHVRARWWARSRTTSHRVTASGL